MTFHDSEAALGAGLRPCRNARPPGLPESR